MRIFLAIATILGLIVHQVDIAGAYLESLLGDNDQLIYMRPPPGIHRIQAGLYCRLLKSLYGLSESGRLWNKNVMSFFRETLGLTQFNGDAGIMIRWSSDGDISIVSIYIEDFLDASNKE